MRMGVVVALAAALAATCARATGLTCDDFKMRWLQAVEDDGDRVARPELDTVAYRREDGTLTRYDLKGIVGLRGAIICETPDYVSSADITVEIETAGEESLLKVERLHNLAAALVCAISRDMRPKACHVAADRLIAGAVADFNEARVKGDPNPLSERDAEPRNDYQVGATANFGMLSFGATYWPQ